MIAISCPFCQKPLDVRVAHSRKAKSKKAFIMWVCPVDGRHFRAFINHQPYVREVLERLESRQQQENGGLP